MSRLKGSKLSISHRRNISLSHIGKKLSAEHRANMSLSNKGHAPSENNRKANSERLRNLWQNPEYREKIRNIQLGRKHSDETREKMKGRKGYWKGKKQSEEANKKRSLKLLGKKKQPFTQEHRNKLSLSHQGKKMSLEQKKKISEKLKGRIFSKTTLLKRSGANNWLWKGGITNAYRGSGWGSFRKAYYDLIGHRCEYCNKKINKKGMLHLHHIKAWRDGGESNYKNVIALCAKCHKEIENSSKPCQFKLLIDFDGLPAVKNIHE